MKKAKNFFLRKKKKNENIKYFQDETMFINPKIQQLKKKKNLRRRIKNNLFLASNYLKSNFKKICYFLAPFLIIIFFALILSFFSRMKNNSKIIIDEKYRNMLPSLSSDGRKNPKYLEELFYTREIYINDAKITPEYIRYIRPINETEEELNKREIPKEEIRIDDSIFAKRPDQYDYINFSKINLEQKLIDHGKIKYNNEPIVSIIIPSYNKEKELLQSIRSIQNQNVKNIEIIIVNDNSNDESSKIFNYLLLTDPRIRIIHHTKNMGCWRTRMDGILYSKGKYVILFDAGDLYEDNYVLQDAINVIEKYDLDSCKFLFRVIRSFNKLERSHVFFHAGKHPKIVYEHMKIKALNDRVFITWGNVWNRLVKAKIFTKALYLCNELMLNIHKNMWDDMWFNRLINRASFNFVVYERVGYVYLQDGNGEGSNLERNDAEKSKKVKEYLGFLYYDYNFSPKDDNKKGIIKVLKDYNETNKKIKLKNLQSNFEILNNLLEALLGEPAVTADDKKYLEQLLKESKEKESLINQNKTL